MVVIVTARGSIWGITPRQSIEAECARRGTEAVVAGCVRLIGGGTVDAGLVAALAGPAAPRFLEDRPDRYWLRVWGLRGLLWAWDDSAAPAVQAGLADEAWRAREMAAKVVAKRLIGDALPAVERLRQDPVPRVRAAAERTVRVLTRAGA
jgi:hypothetical protein